MGEDHKVMGGQLSAWHVSFSENRFGAPVSQLATLPEHSRKRQSWGCQKTQILSASCAAVKGADVCGWGEKPPNNKSHGSHQVEQCAKRAFQGGEADCHVGDVLCPSCWLFFLAGASWDAPELSPLSQCHWGFTVPLSGHQILAAGAQPAGRISAKALGASIPTLPLGRGHLLPPGIAAISCSCQRRDCPHASGCVPPFPAPWQLQAKGLHACSISGHAALSVPTARRAGGGCCHASKEFGEVSRPHELFVQSHLPAPSIEPGSGTAVAELERHSNG